MFIVLLFSIVYLVGCSDINLNKEQNPTSNESDLAYNKYQTLIEGKLYYIPHKAKTLDLAPSYEQFLIENPKLEVIDVESNITDHASNTAVEGYFLFTKEVE